MTVKLCDTYSMGSFIPLLRQFGDTAASAETWIGQKMKVFTSHHTQAISGDVRQSLKSIFAAAGKKMKNCVCGLAGG